MNEFPPQYVVGRGRSRQVRVSVRRVCAAYVCVDVCV